MSWFYFKDLKGETHFFRSREEALKNRKGLGCDRAIYETSRGPSRSDSENLLFDERNREEFNEFTCNEQNYICINNPGLDDNVLYSPSNCDISSDDLKTLESSKEKILITPIEHMSIRAGKVIEQLLGLESTQVDIKNGNVPRIISKGIFLGEKTEVPNYIIKNAINLYCKSDGLIAHFRHNAADPSSFTGHGAFLRHKEDQYSTYHVSTDRVRFAKRDQNVIHGNKQDAIKYVRYLRSKNWYSSFLHPIASLLPLPDMPYVVDSSFIPWHERAANGDI